MADNENNFPTLKFDKDYILRELDASDCDEFYKYFTDPEVNKYILSNIPKTPKDTVDEITYWKSVYKNEEGIYWAIARSDNNKLIGTIGLNNWRKKHNKIELSYDLAKEYWGKGIMSKALKAILEYAFNEMKINRVQALTVPENKNSFFLLQSNGFVNEGLLREYRFHNEKYHNLFMFSILKNDFERLKKKKGI